MSRACAEKSVLQSGGSMESKLREKWVLHRQEILFCLLCTFVWGLLAHGYAFANNPLNFDALNEFNGQVFGDRWKIQLGRVFVPLYRSVVRGALTFPWLIGALAMLYVSIAVFFVREIFEVRSKILTILIAGIFMVNTTVTATTSSYIHDLDSHMFAMMLSVIAVYLWKTQPKGFLWGMLLTGFSMGIYQSFVCVTIMLVLIVSVFDLLSGETSKSVFLKGLKSIVMLIGGGIFYFIAVKLICSLTDIGLTSGGYNSLGNLQFLSVSDFLLSLRRGYIRTVGLFLIAPSMYPLYVTLPLHILMVGIGGINFLQRLADKGVAMMEKLFALFLLVLFPWGMNVTYILTGGMSHDVMHFGLWMVYLFVLLLVRSPLEEKASGKTTKGNIRSVVAIAMVAFTLWGNVQLANASYMKKDMEWEANLSYWTRVMYLIETDERYTSGETPVVFVGNPSANLQRMEGFDGADRLMGSSIISVLGSATKDYYDRYFDYVMMSDILLAPQDVWNGILDNPEIENIPAYPDKGCIRFFDDVMVVRIGDGNAGDEEKSLEFLRELFYSLM